MIAESSDGVDRLLDSVARMIAEQGGELVGREELRDDLIKRRGAKVRVPMGTQEEPSETPSRASSSTTKGPAVRVWLLPDAAGVKHRDVWIAETASGAVVLLQVSSHRRRNGRRNPRERRRWYGIDILSQREVRIAKVLEGSLR